jgi:hypothetical protein
MAALERPKIASYEEHESVWVDTEGKILMEERIRRICVANPLHILPRSHPHLPSPSIPLCTHTHTDNEDHTFCGIMFPIRVKEYLPVEHILLHSISVRGRLGNLTVHVSNETADGNNNTTEIPLRANCWTQLYQGKHKMVRTGYAKLEFPQPLLLKPGQVRLLYVHSTHDGDESIVYDNSNGTGQPRYQDDFITIYSGKAHLSPEPFGQSPVCDSLCCCLLVETC